MEKKYDLLISHNQIRLRSKPYEDIEHQWGSGNIEQGFILMPGLIVADPLVEGTFGAQVIVRKTAQYVADPNAQRAVSLQFDVLDPSNVTVSSASEEFTVGLPLSEGQYTVVYEVCLAEEVYYVFTILPFPSDNSRVLKTDEWGLKGGQLLRSGQF